MERRSSSDRHPISVATDVAKRGEVPDVLSPPARGKPKEASTSLTPLLAAFLIFKSSDTSGILNFCRRNPTVFQEDAEKLRIIIPQILARGSSEDIALKAAHHYILLRLCSENSKQDGMEALKEHLGSARKRQKLQEMAESLVEQLEQQSKRNTKQNNMDNLTDSRATQSRRNEQQGNRRRVSEENDDKYESDDRSSFSTGPAVRTSNPSLSRRGHSVESIPYRTLHTTSAYQGVNSRSGTSAFPLRITTYDTSSFSEGSTVTYGSAIIFYTP